MSNRAQLRVLVVIGTRPEAIKLAPVVHELRKRRGMLVRVCLTGQHKEMLQETLTAFDLLPDHDLALMRDRQRLDETVARAVVAVGDVLDRERPGVVLVEGDTTTGFAASLAAFYRHVAVGHVEAGLRTHRRYYPFPEEMLRRLISQIATFHFAPTAAAAENLVAERPLPDAEVYLTGNPVVDAIRWVVGRVPASPLPFERSADRMLLVTAHRRENLGDPLRRICAALRSIAERHPDVEIVYPVHRNPEVGEIVRSILGGVPRVHLLGTQNYIDFAHLMSASFMILTDSGGIQEEAPVLGKPVLVLRDETERPEAVAAGTARIVGTEVGTIVRETELLLSDPAAYDRMARAQSPFGDGRSAERIADILEERILGVHHEVARLRVGADAPTGPALGHDPR